MNIVDESILKELERLGVKSKREYPPVQRLRSGMISFDAAIGGGLPLDHIIQIYGPEGYGKSLMAMIAAAHNHPTLYVNLESKLDPAWTKCFGISPGENLYMAEAASGEDALDHILQVLRNNASLGFRLIIVDTIAAAYPKSEVLKDMDKNAQMGARATLIQNFMVRSMDVLKNSGCCLLILNQARANFSQYGDDIVVSGGWALKHFSDITIRMKAQEKIKITEGSNLVAHGFKMAGAVKKNKTSSKWDDKAAEREFEVSVLVYPEPMHWAAPDLFEVAKSYGIFQTASGEVYEGRGSVYFAGQELGSSRDKARVTIDSDDALYTAIENATYERMHNA